MTTCSFSAPPAYAELKPVVSLDLGEAEITVYPNGSIVVSAWSSLDEEQSSHELSRKEVAALKKLLKVK